MTIAQRPSKITLPENHKRWKTLLDFLIEQFPLINKEIWVSRFKEGKIHWYQGEAVNAETAYKAKQILCYYREVVAEPIVPFKHEIIFQDEQILVACKPHFLPVTPGGQYVNECLLERVRVQINNPDLVPLHRLDRETAGLVMFSVNIKTRGLYSQLFEQQKISKEYQAVAKLDVESDGGSIKINQQWQVANRLEKSTPKFLMQEIAGKVNAQSKIKLMAVDNNLGLFKLNPVTGKTHQLRLHMMKIGLPILNDKFYPRLLPQTPQDDSQSDSKLYTNPLQLLAKKLSFVDPLSQQLLSFESKRQLATWQA